MSEHWQGIWMATRVKLMSNRGFILTVLGGITLLYGIEIAMIPGDFLKGEYTFIKIDSVFRSAIFSYTMMLLLMYTWSMSVAQEKITEGYPISSAAQFWSNKLIAVLGWVAILTLTVVSYLVSYGLCVYYSGKVSHILMGYEFSLEAVVVGFLVQLVYGMMAIAFFSFLKYCTILSKGWTLVGLLGFIVGSLIVVNLELWSFISLVDVANFYLKETSIVIFLMKGIATTVVLLAISLRLRSVAEKRTKAKGKNEIIIAVLVLVIVVIGIISITSIGILSAGSVEIENQPSDEWKKGMIEGKFSIATDSLDQSRPLVIHEELLGEFYLDQASHYEGDEILVKMYAGAKAYDGISNAPLVRLGGSGEIINNELHLYGEIEDSGTMVLISPFTIPNEFSRYEGRNVFDKIGTSYGGGRGEWVELLIPEEIQYEVRQ